MGISFNDAVDKIIKLQEKLKFNNNSIDSQSEKMEKADTLLSQIVEKINNFSSKDATKLKALLKDIENINLDEIKGISSAKLDSMVTKINTINNKLDETKNNPQGVEPGPPSNFNPEAAEFVPAAQQGETKGDRYESEEEVTFGGRRRKRKRGGFKFTSNAIKSRKSRFMTRKRKSKSPKRRKTPKRRKRTRRKRRKRKGRKSRRKSRRKRRRRR